MHYIKGKTIDASIWGKMVSFGKSVHLNIATEPLEIASFINHIEDTLNQPVRVKLPKVDVVKDSRVIQRLDRDLARSILRTQEEPEINIEEFTMSGVDFIFSGNYEYSLYLKGESAEAVRLNELSLESLSSFLRSNNINLLEEINNLRVKVHHEYGRDHAKPIKFYLDFIEEEDYSGPEKLDR